jgi:hypothetical protein
MAIIATIMKVRPVVVERQGALSPKSLVIEEAPVPGDMDFDL